MEPMLKKSTFENLADVRVTDRYFEECILPLWIASEPNLSLIDFCTDWQARKENNLEISRVLDADFERLCLDRNVSKERYKTIERMMERLQDANTTIQHLREQIKAQNATETPETDDTNDISDTLKCNILLKYLASRGAR